MKAIFQSLILSLTILGTALIANLAHAETTAGEKVQEGAQDAGKNVKKAGRAIQDKACEMVHGKLECAGKKAANKMRNAKDEISDKSDDVKKKID